MATCFVYIRKSTNVPKKQINSLERQTFWATKVLKERLDFDIIGIDGRVCDIPQNGFIVESVSAKEESKLKRSGFQNMMTAIGEHGVDYVLSCYASRISRNEKDTRTFMDALKGEDRKIRLGVITQERVYLASSKSDMLALEGALFAAKQENGQRSIDATESDEFNKVAKKKFTSKFPFGYKQFGDDNKVAVNPEKAQLVRLAYEWRLNGCQWTEIAKEFESKGYKMTGGNIKAAILHTIQYGEFEYRPTGKMYPVMNEGYQPIISKPLYDKLVEYEELHHGKHGKTNPVSSKNSQKLLDKMVYDVAGKMLQGAITAEKVYYRQPNKNFTYKIHVAESKLFREAGKQIHKFSPPLAFSVLIEAQLREKLALTIKEQDRSVNIVEGEIKGLKDNINGWLDKLGTTTQSLLIQSYEGKIIETTEKIERMEQELTKMKANKKDIGAMAKMYANLFKDLPGTYKKVSKSEKADILRGLGVSFVIGPDTHITLIGGRFQDLFIPNK